MRAAAPVFPALHIRCGYVKPRTPGRGIDLDRREPAKYPPDGYPHER